MVINAPNMKNKKPKKSIVIFVFLGRPKTDANSKIITGDTIILRIR